MPSKFSDIVNTLVKLARRHFELISRNQIGSSCEFDWETIFNKLRELDYYDKGKSELFSIVQNIKTHVEKESAKSEIPIVFVGDEQLLGKSMVLTYEVVGLIYMFGPERIFRRNNFLSLLKVYYKKLKLYLDSRDIAIFSWEAFEYQASKILPLTKLEQILMNFRAKMKSFLIVSEITEVAKYLSLEKEDFYEVVKGKMQQKELKDSVVEFTINPFNGITGNYHTIAFKVDTGTKQYRFDTFLKFIKTGYFEVLNRQGCNKEIFYYAKFLPLLKIHGFSKLADMAPEYYFGRPNDVIILENLVTQGYHCTRPEFDGMFYLKEVEMVLGQIAKLHASAVLLENILWKYMNKNLDELYGEYLQDVYEDPKLRNTTKIGFDSIIYLIDKYFENYIQNRIMHEDVIDPEDGTNCSVKKTSSNVKYLSKNQFKERVCDISRTYFDSFKKSPRFSNTLCHGDLSPSNIIFKYESKTKELLNCKLVDFKNVRYCPPLHDVLFFVFVSTYAKLRAEHLDQLIEKYYLSLSTNLKCFDFEVSEIYTLEEFKECCDYLKPYAICNAILNSQIQSPTGIAIEDDIAFFEKSRINYLEKACANKKFLKIQMDLLFDLYNACSLHE